MSYVDLGLKHLAVDRIAAREERMHRTASNQGCYPDTAGTPGHKRQLAASHKAGQLQRQSSTSAKKENSASSNVEEGGTTDAQHQVSLRLTLSAFMIPNCHLPDTTSEQRPLFPRHAC